MAGPITWRNVNGDNPMAAAVGYNAAQNSFDSGFNALNKVLQQHQQTEQANWENQKQNNTSAFLDQLQKYRTPEELEAARQSGAIDNLRTQFGAQIDQNAVRGALDTRAAFLRKDATEGAQFADFTRGRNEREVIDTLLARAEAGDPNALKEVQGLDLMNNAEVMGQIQGIQDTATQRQYLANAEGRANQSHALNQRTGNLRLSELENQVEGRNTFNKALTERMQQEEDIRARTADIAQKLDIPLEGGIPNLDGLAPEHVDYFKQQVAEAGIPQLTSSAEFLRNLRNSGIAGNQDPAQVQAQVTAASTILNPSAGLTQVDQEALATQVNEARQPHAAKRAIAQDAIQKLERDNPYLLEQGDPAVAQAEVLKTLTQVVDNKAEREEAGTVLMDWLSNGVNVRGERITLTPSMANTLLRQAALDGEGLVLDNMDDALKGALETYMTPKVVQQYKDAFETHKNLKAGLAGLDLKEAVDIKKAQRSFMSDRGIAPMPLDAFQRRLKQDQ